MQESSFFFQVMQKNHNFLTVSCESEDYDFFFLDKLGSLRSKLLVGFERRK
jgi:hypothetical protein